MEIINQILTKHFNVPIPVKSASQWIGQDGWLGKSKMHRKNGEIKRGRWGWIMKDEYQEFVYKNDKKHHVKYIKYIKNTGASITTIGYARKSCGNEPVAVRARLLQNMVNRLRKRGRCFKIFVSPQSNADELLAERDVRSNFEMKQLTNVKGTMQDLIERINTNYKPIWLVVIDYAALSTNFYDIQNFVRKSKQIVEIMVDTGNDFDIMTRYDVLNNDNLVEKFKCGNAPIKRSL